MERRIDQSRNTVSQSRVARRFYSPSRAEIRAQFAVLITGPNEDQFSVQNANPCVQPNFLHICC